MWNENDTDLVYTPQATDSDALTYTLGGPDADKFVINGDGSVSFVTAPDFEAPGSAAGTNSYSFSVTASDGTLSDVQAVTVNVADVAEITYDNVTLDFDAVGDVNSIGPLVAHLLHRRPMTVWAYYRSRIL